MTDSITAKITASHAGRRPAPNPGYFYHQPFPGENGSDSPPAPALFVDDLPSPTPHGDTCILLFHLKSRASIA
ncbi:hypothetical protein GR925_37585 [Streptomyces sp. HUCO-GS316]|uniref:hypothetical protein n=1 Tax=Streptomyces sp. HUCO-GS316 TaxID=2692198 RepID=UPI00136FD292|nr:hypothetical protein [Streptomyces sp. HUCO-GS316]MXM68954.1 hypothetical protein [Streptomyces sp. HUCO-GS316]